MYRRESDGEVFCAACRESQVVWTREERPRDVPLGSWRCRQCGMVGPIAEYFDYGRGLDWMGYCSHCTNWGTL